MGSSFFELNVATTGLFTANGALRTIAHNVANADRSKTMAYSRQYIEARASKPLALNTGKGMVGTGSEIYGIGQIRNFYLDKKYWSETPVLGEYSMKSIQLALVERTFNEIPGLGIKGSMDNFFATLSDLSTHAGDDTYRFNALQAGTSMTKLINNIATSLQNQQFDINAEVGTMVEVINSLGVQITTLNKQIYMAETDGSRANDLRDQRAVLVDELSKYVNVTVYEDERNKDYAAGKYPNPEDRGKSDKRFTVLINGQVFVDHYDFNSLRVEERDYYANPTDIPKLYDIYFNGSNTRFDIYSPTLTGQLKGLIDMRDGNNGYKGIGGAITNIDSVSVVGKTTITLSSLSRMDYMSTSGKLTLRDVNGVTRVVKYTDYTIVKDALGNPTGEVTFEIDDASVPAGFNTNWSVTVGETDNYKGVPHYMNKLNNLVRTFAKAMNDVFLQGYDSYEKQNGLVLFSDGINNTGATIDYSQLNAMNFQINPLLFGDVKLFAAAGMETDGISANSTVFKLMAVKDNPSLFKEGKIADYIAGIALEIGIDAKQADNFEVNYTDVVATINNQRISISGVDLNEEMTNMLMYEQIFAAASKLINVINEIYDILINQVRA